MIASIKISDGKIITITAKINYVGGKKGYMVLNY